MKNKSKLSKFLILGGLCLACGLPGDGVGFHPAAGTTLTKTFTLESELTLDEMETSLNGNPVDPKMFGGMEMTTSITQTIGITDEYVAVAQGRPSKLKRTFNDVSSTTQVSMKNEMMGEQNQTIDGKSALAGLTVEFVWDEDQGKYSVGFAEGSEGEDELLEGLVENTDLRGFLPKGEVKEGATWSVDPQLLRDVLAPSGSVKIGPENPPEGFQGQQQPSMDEMLGQFEGTVQAEYGGARNEGGTRVAVIKLKVEVSTAKDVTQFMAESMENAELPEGAEMDVESFDIEYAFEGEGELHWDLAAGLPHSLSLAGQATMTIDSVMMMSMQGTEQKFENSMTMSGDQSVSVASE
jgi:hypothetical protein